MLLYRFWHISVGGPIEMFGLFDNTEKAQKAMEEIISEATNAIERHHPSLKNIINPKAFILSGDPIPCDVDVDFEIDGKSSLLTVERRGGFCLSMTYKDISYTEDVYLRKNEFRCAQIID